MNSIIVKVKHPRCPYCHDAVLTGDEKSACPDCMAWHHKECYQDHKACSACGRKETVRGRIRSAGVRPSRNQSQRQQQQRLFWAFQTPPAMNSDLEEIQSDLRTNCRTVVRWNSPQFTPFHGTLKFIGDTDKTEEIIEKTKSIVSTIPILNLSLTHVGQFGGDEPTVLWCGVGGRHELELKDLFRDLDRGLSEIGIRRERRSYQPHITLGYVAKRQSRGDLAELKTAVEQRFLPAGLNFTVENITLFESVRERGELTYKVVTRLPLR